MNTNTIGSISKHNDRFRESFVGGRVLITPYVQQLEADVRDKVLQAVREFDTFTEDNDPHDEHDFGSIKIAGETFFWKIDLYDKDYEFRSPEPSNPEVTRRVLTVMHAHEY